jgi:signal transduction histidine kinase
MTASGMVGAMTRALVSSSGSARERPAAIEARVRDEAQARARRAIWFIGHVAIVAAVCLFLAVVATPFAALVVGLGWGVGVVAHGVFGVLGPELRSRWVDAEVARRVQTSVGDERRALAGAHDRALAELCASVAHEIRNPIAAARSLVQQMAEDPTATDHAEFGRIAAEELDRVERAIAHLLRFARDEETRFEPVRLSEVVEAAVHTLRERLGTGHVRVEHDVEADCVLRADPDKLRRVVINLVSNAVDAVEERGPADPQVRLVGGRNLAGTEVWLSVTDNGVGIEPERLGKVFDPFHTSREGGTGLGLAIAKKIVEGHGGRMDLTSTPGEGTEAVLTFPAWAPGEDGPG